jgi:hypothetical protein
MDLKYGKALVGAIAAVTVSAFTVPFCSNAAASTGTMIGNHDAGSAIQLAQAEQEESVERKSEEKTKEVQTGTDSAPGTVTVAPGSVVVAPSAPAPEVSGEVEKKHEESKTVESEHSENGMGVSGSVGVTSERRENDMSSDANANAAPGTTVEQEHSEEHQTKEKVEQN